MSRHSFLAALLGALLSTAAFAQMGVSTYTITRVDGAPMPPMFVVSQGTMLVTQHESISAVLDTIRKRVTNDGDYAAPVAIQFGYGEETLNIGTQMAKFPNTINTWDVLLLGKITSAAGKSAASDASGTVVIGNRVSATSDANIVNTNANGVAISVEGSGAVKITGGTVAVTGNNSFAVEIPFEGGNIASRVILGGSPTITGGIRVWAGALSVITASPDDPAFNPAGKQYTLIVNESGGGVPKAVVGGADFIDNFTLANSNFILAVSGNDLVLAVPNSSSSSLTPSSSSGGGSSSSSETVPIAHSPLPAIHSEATAYFNMKGEPMGSSKPATPGVYLVKHGSSIRKVVVR